MALGRWRGPLHGIPIGLKDLIDTAGIPTTAASELYKHRIPIQDAEVVQKLGEAGAVLLGKQNLHEFAYGGSSMISCFGEVRNPWNPAHIAGGSSGGSAAAVAAGIGLRRHRHRHRGLDSRAGRALRRGGNEADIRAGERPGSDSAVGVAGSRGADCSDGRRCGDAFASDLKQFSQPAE